jgi:RND family efflux transporter MFP subunit
LGRNDESPTTVKFRIATLIGDDRLMPGARYRAIPASLGIAMRRLAFLGFASSAMLFALAGCGSQPAPKQTETLIDVSVAPVGSATDIQMIRAAGTVRLRQETQLGFTTAGRIARITVNAGDRVSKGQLLAFLDTTTVNAQLGAANAEQVRAGGELRRSTKLYRDGWVTKARLDNAQAAYDAAVASTKVRRFATETARIYAPSSGVILARAAEPTQVVNEGTPILTLGEEARGYVLRIPVPDRDAVHLAVGLPATVRIVSLGETVITGQVIQIGGRADQGTGTFEVEISLPKTVGMRSGQIGSAEIVSQDQSQSSSILVPPSALFAPRAGEGFVYVVPEGGDTVSLRKIKIAEARDGGVRVLSGLNPGELVVVSGVERLADKKRVRVQRRTG